MLFNKKSETFEQKDIFMSSGKGFANRPSQADREYVINSKGEQVKNVAYKGNNKNLKNKINNDLSGDFNHAEEYDEFDIQLAVDNILDSIDDFIIDTNKRSDLFGYAYDFTSQEFSRLSQELLREKNDKIEQLKCKTLGFPEGDDIWKYEGEKYFDMKYEEMENSQKYKDNVHDIEQEYDRKYDELFNNHPYSKALLERKEIIEDFQEQLRENYDNTFFTNDDFLKEFNKIYDNNRKHANSSNNTVRNEAKNRHLAATTLAKCLKEEEGIDTSIWMKRNGNEAVGFGINITEKDNLNDETIEKLEKLDIYSKTSAKSQDIEDYYRSRIYLPDENISCELVYKDGEYYVKGIEIEWGRKAIAEPREATTSDNIVDTMKKFMKYKEEK